MAEDPQDRSDLQDDLATLDGFDPDSFDGVMQYLVDRYGNKAEIVAANLRLWEAFGRVFEAW
eukprot:5859379-Pleurochrysis_carterae.AAC.1